MDEKYVLNHDSNSKNVNSDVGQTKKRKFANEIMTIKNILLKTKDIK